MVAIKNSNAHSSTGYLSKYAENTESKIDFSGENTVYIVLQRTTLNQELVIIHVARYCMKQSHTVIISYHKIINVTVNLNY